VSDVAVRLGYTLANRPNETLRQTFGLAAIVALAIYLSSEAGFLLRLPQSGIGFVWPPNAVLLVALLLVPESWGIVLGAALVGHVAAHTQDGTPASIQALSFFGNATQAGLAAVLIRRFSGRVPYLTDLRSAGVFVAAAVIAPVVASFVPAIGYVWSGWAPDFWAAWWARVFSNVTTTLILPPVLLLAPSAFVRLRENRGRALEFAGMIAGLFLVHMIAFGWAPAGRVGWPALLYAPLPLLLWAAVRFGPFGLAAALTLVALQWLPNARSGAGVFADTPAVAIVSLQAFLFVAGIPLMILAALAQDRKRSEAALRQSEARQRAILTAIPDLMFLQTADGVYLDFHAKDPRDLLLPPHEFLGKRTEDVLPPDLAARFGRAFAQVTDEEPSLVRYAVPIRGETRSFEARIARCDGDKRLTIVQDITERTRAEERLQESERRYVLAASAARVGVWEWDVTSNHVYVDMAIHSDLGLRPGQVGPSLDDWLQLVHVADRARIQSTLQAAGREARPTIFEYDCRMIHQNGGIRWLHVRGAVVPQEGIGPKRVSGTATDITDRKQAEEALHRAQSELARTGRTAALGELAATIAHEVDQPLCAIVANANACLRWLDDSDAGVQDIREALTDVVADANRASDVIRGTRELFRQAQVDTTSVDVNIVVRDVMALKRTRVERGQVDVVIEMAEEPLLVQGNRTQLEQVVFNLVSNALDAMRGVDRPARLELRTWREQREIRLSVADSGAGFTPKEAARMFESFFTTKPDGLGMGLALTRTIVHQHRGKLWAEPRAGGGSVFHVALPIAETSSA
jgi:PAS domain S-box-containing protein